MKKLIWIFLFVLMGTGISLKAQEVISQTVEQTRDQSYFQLSGRLGWDLKQWYNNDTPYIDYKGGLETGFSADYYWNWFGLGLDFDFIKNQPKNLYPTNFVFADPDKWQLSEQSITRIFLGIGPSFKYQNKPGNITAEFNIRGGLANIKGGRTLLGYDAPPVVPFNFHAGYDAKMVLSGKLQLRGTYFFHENWGVQAGAYYMIHIGAEELTEEWFGKDYSSFYYPFKETSGNARRMLARAGGPYDITGHPVTRETPIKSNISSIGIFAGIAYRWKPAKKTPKIAEKPKPEACADCDNCTIVITAKDKISGELLPGTDVVLTGLQGNIIKTGTTNSYGIVTFHDVKKGNYVVKGKLYEQDMENTTIVPDDFSECIRTKSGIQKDILYSDPSFLLKGQVFECNTTNALPGANINMREQNGKFTKNTVSGSKGDFVFKVPQASTLLLKGEKDGYFSNEVKVVTNDYDRSKSLFINFEMCADPCGKAIRLNNINFDLDKAEILPQSIPDLERIVKLMKANPNIKVEMSSHTDSRGSKAYNQRLSQRRAEATVQYLVSRGIDRNRLIARGAGETELLNECDDNTPCPEEKHRQNRRTEFKIICD